MPLLESLTLKGGDATPQQSTDGVIFGLPNPLVGVIRKRYLSGHGLKRLTIHDCVGLGLSEVAELNPVVDDLIFKVGKYTQEDSDSTA
jgi:hypothetical protein